MAECSSSIAAARWQAYEFPLRRPWVSARGTTAVRRGWLLRLRTDTGVTGYGDCAPLPGIGTESEATAGNALEEYVEPFLGKTVTAAIRLLPPAPSVTPAVRCACETALLDLAARTRHVPLHRFLAPDSPGRVAVNAMIGTHSDWADAAAEAISAGYNVLKLKLGVADAAIEVAALNALVASTPARVRLRLDINRGWSFATARRVLSGLDPERIEAVEEPAHDADDAQLAQLQDATTIAIALDESLAGRSSRTLPVRRQVLKPMAAGGLLPILDRATEAETVVTTSVDSAIGVRAACHVAAALNNDLAHGLATGQWLSQDFAPPPRIVAGSLTLPDKPGIGLDPA